MYISIIATGKRPRCSPLRYILSDAYPRLICIYRAARAMCLRRCYSFSGFIYDQILRIPIREDYTNHKPISIASPTLLRTDNTGVQISHPSFKIAQNTLFEQFSARFFYNSIWFISR